MFFTFRDKCFFFIFVREEGEERKSEFDWWNLINYVEEKNVSSQAFSKFCEDISFLAWMLLLEMLAERIVSTWNEKIENASWTICEENRIIAKWVILNWNMINSIDMAKRRILNLIKSRMICKFHRYIYTLDSLTREKTRFID